MSILENINWSVFHNTEGLLKNDTPCKTCPLRSLHPDYAHEVATVNYRKPVREHRCHSNENRICADHAYIKAIQNYLYAYSVGKDDDFEDYI